MTEGEGSPRARTGSGAVCICKDEDQDVLPGWWCLLQTDHGKELMTVDGAPSKMPR